MVRELAPELTVSAYQQVTDAVGTLWTIASGGVCSLLPSEGSCALPLALAAIRAAGAARTDGGPGL